MNKPAEKYESVLLSELLSEISPQEQEKTNKRMSLAVQIDEARIRKAWSKKELADRMGKRPSEITKWLSGTHNFTTETLFDLEYHLDAKFVNVEEKQREQILHFHFNLTQKINTEECLDIIKEPKQNYTYAAWEVNNQGSC